MNDPSWPICQKCGEYEHDCLCSQMKTDAARARPAGADSVQRLVGCQACAEKKQIIVTLHRTCASYEARIKRFQTLARNRRKNASRQKKGGQPEDVAHHRLVRTSDEKRLTEAGWRKTRKGWKSPYTGNVLHEEKAVRTELLMTREASPNVSLSDKGSAPS